MDDFFKVVRGVLQLAFQGFYVIGVLGLNTVQPQAKGGNHPGRGFKFHIFSPKARISRPQKTVAP